MKFVGFAIPSMRTALALTFLAATVSACGGGAATTPVASPSTSTSGSITSSTTASTSLTVGPFNGGYSATVTIPAMSTTAHIRIAVSQTQPAGTPAVATVARTTQSINAANISPFGYISFT